MRNPIISRFIPLFVLLMVYYSFSSAQQNIDNVEEQTTGKTAEGWIYELEPEIPATDESMARTVAEPADPSTAGNSGNSNIDLIIGGQGKEGIAKRGTLKVID